MPDPTGEPATSAPGAPAALPRSARRSSPTPTRARRAAAPRSKPTPKPAPQPTPKPAPQPTAKPAAQPTAHLPPAKSPTDERDRADAPLAPPIPAPRRPGLIPTDIADALTAVLGKATAAIREHEHGSRQGGDIENVHQMRVATRRIRAYLKAAKPALDPAAADQVRADLAELAGALGQVRDLDVMIDRLHSEAAALAGHDSEALENLVSSLDDDRSAARRALVLQLDDPGHEGLLAELDQAAERPPVADPWASLTDLAAAEFDRLASAQRKLDKKYGDRPPDEDLHALRILGKRARYTTELLDKTKTITAYLAALAHFQEVLGNHQDAYVLENQLRAMVARSGDVDAAIAAGRVIQGCRERREEAVLEYPKAWRSVVAAAQRAYPR